MQPGPSVVVHCPFCNALGSYETRLSGNNFGGTYYTDGKAVLPMDFYTTSVVQCKACNRPFLRQFATEVGEFDRWSQSDLDEEGRPINPAFRAAPELIEPTEAQYLTGLDELIELVPQEELAIRLFAWWRGNDRYRADAPEPETADSPTIVALRKTNIDGLLRLLPEEDSTDHSQPLMRAEVFRQIGEFDKALAILTRPYPDELNGAIARLSSLCQEKDSMLRTL